MKKILLCTMLLLALQGCATAFDTGPCREHILIPDFEGEEFYIRIQV